MKLFLTLVISIFLSGCASSTGTFDARLSDVSGYRNRGVKINSEVCLFISDLTKSYSPKATRIATFVVYMGNGLENDAKKSLSNVFSSVKQVNVKSDIGCVNKDVIEITFSPETVIDLGVFTFSPNKVTTSLQATVSHNEKEVLKLSTVGSKAEAKGGFDIDVGYIQEAGAKNMEDYLESLKTAASEALHTALENLNDAILEKKVNFVPNEKYK